MTAFTCFFYYAWPYCHWYHHLSFASSLLQSVSEQVFLLDFLSLLPEIFRYVLGLLFLSVYLQSVSGMLLWHLTAPPHTLH